MAKMYRAGIVGCGGMGRSHAKAWTEHPAVELVSVADIDKGVAQHFAEEFDVPEVFADYHEMYRDAALDVVSIPTWKGVRAEIAVAAADAGIRGIIGEKPMAGLLNTGTHGIDLWRYFLSDSETSWVIGQTSRTSDR